MSQTILQPKPQWTCLESAFHKNVAPKFTGLDYDPNEEITFSWFNIDLNKEKIVYSKDRLKITALKYQTWMYDDYDIFIKVKFFVDNNLVYEIKDY